MIAVICNRVHDAKELIKDLRIPHERAVICGQEKDAQGYKFERLYFTYNAYENPQFEKILEEVERNMIKS